MAFSSDTFFCCLAESGRAILAVSARILTVSAVASHGVPAMQGQGVFHVRQQFGRVGHACSEQAGRCTSLVGRDWKVP